MDSKEDDNKYSIGKRTASPSTLSPVKSKAIVKYSAFQTPATFIRLQCNTDLNAPPSNWLSNSADSYGLQHVLSHSTGFSSFRMAHMFPDCVGEVDVVSDAENIKNLLKLPYSHEPVSMMVHRIENTLLIDDFDIHKHLLRTAETEWDWLRKFFFDNIQKALNEKDIQLYRRSKSRNILQQRSLISKFLYHSLLESNNVENSHNEIHFEEEPTTRLTLSGPALPEPSEEVPDPTTKHKYNRNVVWTFEDIQMLIGTDMPIFGGSTHPCISLRLRDMNKPISVLTGIDYWLDNLMSNVPEVVMCYHLSGIVQKYEFIKTEDLPHLEDSKFSPKLIRDIAQNILSFLKSNATKAGHTYWLFKGRNDDVVKLYDLTSLCSGVSDEKGQNPFTVPVAMLLYRVARNMKHRSDGIIQTGTIRMLLKNCIELLNKEKYPQIITSSHYMLSDLYIPAKTNPNEPVFDDNQDSDSSNYEDEYIDEASLQSSINEDIKQLRLNEASDQDSEPFIYKAPPSINGSISERCLKALQHVAAGLDCLQYFPSASMKLKEEQEKKKKQEEEENLNMAHPFEAIPMPYSPLNQFPIQSDTKNKSKRRNKKDKKKKSVEINESESIVPGALLLKPKAEAIPTWQEPDRSDDESWNIHLKTLLYEKACLIYAILAEQEFIDENYGNSLKYIKTLVKCRKILKILLCSSQHVQESCLLGRAGDCCCMIDKHWSQVQKYQNQYNHISDVQLEMEERIAKNYVQNLDQYENWNGLLPDKIESNEQMLKISCQCYERALASEPGAEKRNLLRRLGNVHNELGTLYMNQACSNFNQGNTDVQKLINKSQYNLETGIRIFESIDDKPNLALLHSNMGRLMRLCAHVHSNSLSNKMSEIVGQERSFYNKALASYQKARQVLLNRNTNPDIWDAITWELSTACYNMATLLQDYPAVGSRTAKELEQEIVEMLHKALEYCDMETPSYRQPIYQFRGAKIHHRLASLYHNSFRNTNQEARKKSIIGLCKLHYERATTILLALEDAAEYITVQMEYVALYSLLFQNSSSVSAKYKYLSLSLNLILDIIPMLKMLVEKHINILSKLNHACNEQKTKTPIKSKKKSITKRTIVKSNIENEEKIEGNELDYNTENVIDEREIKLMNIVESQLQFILLNLTKLFNKQAKGITMEHCTIYGALYKKLYSISLRKPVGDEKCFAQHLYSMLTQVKENKSKVAELNL